MHVISRSIVECLEQLMFNLERRWLSTMDPVTDLVRGESHEEEEMSACDNKDWYRRNTDRSSKRSSRRNNNDNNNSNDDDDGSPNVEARVFNARTARVDHQMYGVRVRVRVKIRLKVRLRVQNRETKVIIFILQYFCKS